MHWTRRDELDEQAENADGAYLLRTNMSADDPQKLWDAYSARAASVLCSAFAAFTARYVGDCVMS